MAAYDPLYGPDDEESASPAALDVELRLARELLAELAPLNIHSHDDMLRAATGLFYRLRSLLAAIEAERGRP
jgi:hypothetical protein